MTGKVLASENNNVINTTPKYLCYQDFPNNDNPKSNVGLVFEYDEKKDGDKQEWIAYFEKYPHLFTPVK